MTLYVVEQLHWREAGGEETSPDDHGPDTRDLILALHEPFPRREHGAPARARRHGLKPMYILHGGEPPSVHPQRDGTRAVRAGRCSSRPGLQRTGHCVARLPASSLVPGGVTYRHFPP